MIQEKIDEFCEEKELVLNYKLKWFYDWIGGEESGMFSSEAEQAAHNREVDGSNPSAST